MGEAASPEAINSQRALDVHLVAGEGPLEVDAEGHMALQFDDQRLFGGQGLRFDLLLEVHLVYAVVVGGGNGAADAGVIEDDLVPAVPDGVLGAATTAMQSRPRQFAASRPGGMCSSCGICSPSSRDQLAGGVLEI